MVGYDAAEFRQHFREVFETQGFDENAMAIYEKAFQSSLNGYSYHETTSAVVDEVII